MMVAVSHNCFYYTSKPELHIHMVLCMILQVYKILILWEPTWATLSIFTHKHTYMAGSKHISSRGKHTCMHTCTFTDPVNFMYCFHLFTSIDYWCTASCTWKKVWWCVCWQGLLLFSTRTRCQVYGICNFVYHSKKCIDFFST